MESSTTKTMSASDVEQSEMHNVLRYKHSKDSDQTGWKHIEGSRGGWGTRVRTPPETSQKYSFFSNSGPEPLKKTKPAINVGP